MHYRHSLVACYGPPLQQVVCNLCRFEGLTREGIPHGKGVLVVGNGTGGGFGHPERGDRQVDISLSLDTMAAQIVDLTRCNADTRENSEGVLLMVLVCTRQLMVRCTEASSCMERGMGKHTLKTSRDHVHALCLTRFVSEHYTVMLWQCKSMVQWYSTSYAAPDTTSLLLCAWMV